MLPLNKFTASTFKMDGIITRIMRITEENNNESMNAEYRLSDAELKSFEAFYSEWSLEMAFLRLEAIVRTCLNAEDYFLRIGKNFSPR
ncbi:hypothetical protein T01_11362 [Trichinella spiralis]|uniref:Uncharacterized protein n=1 Tax=Trichinella spiralis TaxID=6334 RepID=A0A0V1BDD0_TRISP|nr:hypothetical protein T01_11362 [Trichinella spiralis]